MRINCLGCGHMIDVGDDYGDYRGPIRCRVCGNTLELQSEGGHVKSVRLTDEVSRCEGGEC